MEEKIIEGNKLIAEFLGYKKKAFVTGYAGTFYYRGKERFCQPESMKYHTSWDWLMPVVEKIEDCRAFDDFGFSFFIDNWTAVIKKCLTGEIIVSRLSQDKSKIEAVWQAVIQFIEWYNQNKQP